MAKYKTSAARAARAESHAYKREVPNNALASVRKPQAEAQYWWDEVLGKHPTLAPDALSAHRSLMEKAGKLFGTPQWAAIQTRWIEYWEFASFRSEGLPHIMLYDPWPEIKPAATDVWWDMIEPLRPWWDQMTDRLVARYPNLHTCSPNIPELLVRLALRTAIGTGMWSGLHGANGSLLRYLDLDHWRRTAVEVWEGETTIIDKSAGDWVRKQAAETPRMVRSVTDLRDPQALTQPNLRAFQITPGRRKYILIPVDDDTEDQDIEAMAKEACRLLQPMMPKKPKIGVRPSQRGFEYEQLMGRYIEWWAWVQERTRTGQDVSNQRFHEEYSDARNPKRWSESVGTVKGMLYDIHHWLKPVGDEGWLD